MTDKGLRIGWELWWARAVAKRFRDQRQQKVIVSVVSEKYSLGRSETYQKLKTVSALLDPELESCSGDLFLLIGRIQSLTNVDDKDGPAVAEVDLDTGEVTKFEGWDDALAASLHACEFDKHPASYLSVLIGILETERKRLNECLKSVDSVLSLCRGPGRTKEIPDDPAKPSRSKGLPAPK